MHQYQKGKFNNQMMGGEKKERDIHTLYTDAALLSDFPSLNLLYGNT